MVVELPPPAGPVDDGEVVVVLLVAPADPADLGAELPQAANPMEQAASTTSDPRRRRDMGEWSFPSAFSVQRSAFSVA
jgi:hypothetical protein